MKYFLIISGLTGHRVGGWECTKFGLATHYVRYRVETSHWSRSIQIPCSDWLRPWCCYAIGKAQVASVHEKDLL